MALTNDERQFLAAFIYEATNDPFTGPATNDLQRNGIYYSDIRNLMAAYHRENESNQEGLGGKRSTNPPASPWPSKQVALHRDHEVAAEIASTTNQPVA